MDRYSIKHNSIQDFRGRSLSPKNNPTRYSREELKKELKWSIIGQNPLNRFSNFSNDINKTNILKILNDNDNKEESEDVSEEEQVSDDNDNDKFKYNYNGNKLPNFSFEGNILNTITQDLENLSVKEMKDMKKNMWKRRIGEEIEDKVSNDDMSQVKSEHMFYNVNVRGNEKKVLKEKREFYDDNSVKKNQKYLSMSLGDENLNSKLASKLNELIKESDIDLNKSHSRVIQTITRGNFFSFAKSISRPKMFMLCMDFSPESIFALEWSLGTVLIDGSVLFVINVIEDTDKNHHLKASSINESLRESHRVKMLNYAKKYVLSLLKLTKLQIHVVIEIVHHPIPRHMILEFVDNLKPNLVILGSKGQSSIKGVLLGSLSNYIVNKLPVPVMVVREKIKKINKFKTDFCYNQFIKPLTLSEARID